MSYRDNGFFRRKFPRRAFSRRLGILCHGTYQLTNALEIGEGGLAFFLDTPLVQDAEIVINFQIPGGDFVSLRSDVRSIRVHQGRHVHGVSFKNAHFSHKRQIRAFVSARGAKEVLFG